MKVSEWVKEILRDFLIIFASIMIIITVLRQIFVPDANFELQTVFTIMAFSFLGALTGIILYAPRSTNENQMRIRMIVHFIVLEALLVSLALLLDLVQGIFAISLLAVQIAAVYMIVRLLAYRSDQKESQKINERLQTFKHKL